MTAGYLLDTHVFLNIAKLDRPLSKRLVEILDDPEADLFLSTVSIAEACIKANLGKLTLPAIIAADPAAGFRDAADKLGYRLLPLEAEHAGRLLGLPHHHRDPFDRLLICQAMAENLILVSDDRVFPLYSGLSLLRS